MASANGARTPPTDSTPDLAPADVGSADNKRKREHDDAPPEVASTPPSSQSAQTQRDILEILEQYDTDPSFLKHAIEQKSTTERSPKKARLSDPSHNSTTIASKLAKGVYAKLQDLRKDAEHVSESLIASVREKARDREGQGGRLLVEDLKQMQHVQGFEQAVSDIIEQEAKYDAAHRDSDVKMKAESGLPNDHAVDAKPGAASRSGTVLTLFGNAPTPKQLFSSMQHSPDGRAGPAVKTELPIEELSLPNGLTATRIMSAPAGESKKAPTFEEAFATPFSLPQLQPPKSHKRSSTRDRIITWEFKDPGAKRDKKGGYTTQSLTVGEWLGYGGADSKEESSPLEKIKLRDRVLSSGESSQQRPSRASLEDNLASEEEALFRKAYSSFAPSRDNSRAIVPEETKSMVWWHKVGNRKYQETFAIDPALLDEQLTAPPIVSPRSEEKDEDFSRVVEEMEEWDEEMPDAEPSRDKTDVNEVLREISELLQTLASHQRIRNSTLTSTSTSRTPISPAPTLSSRVGRPDSPTEEEFSTYYALRRELAYLVLKLPPYAVAKLNGDQLSELGVSRIITFEGKNARGTMEEDQVARLAKYTAMATAAGIATLTRTGSAGSQHYSSTNQRTPAIGQAANTRHGQSGLYGAARTPISQPQFARPISNQSSYGTPSATAPRPGYGQPNQYSRPAGPQGYGQNGQHYYQRQISQGTPSYGGYGQHYAQSTSQTQQRPGYSSQPLSQHQQRAQAAAQNAVGYQTNAQAAPQVHSPFNRTASPIKPANYQPPLQPSPAPRPQQQFQQPSSDTATPVNYPSQPQTPVNGIQPQQRPVAPRDASGTPQPPPVHANGHA